MHASSPLHPPPATNFRLSGTGVLSETYFQKQQPFGEMHLALDGNTADKNLRILHGEPKNSPWKVHASSLESESTFQGKWTHFPRKLPPFSREKSEKETGKNEMPMQGAIR